MPSFWFLFKNTSFYRRGISVLPERWHRCITSERRYIEEIPNCICFEILYSLLIRETRFPNCTLLIFSCIQNVCWYSYKKSLFCFTFCQLITGA